MPFVVCYPSTLKGRARKSPEPGGGGGWDLNWRLILGLGNKLHKSSQLYGRPGSEAVPATPVWGKIWNSSVDWTAWSCDLQASKSLFFILRWNKLQVRGQAAKTISAALSPEFLEIMSGLLMFKPSARQDQYLHRAPLLKEQFISALGASFQGLALLSWKY